MAGGGAGSPWGAAATGDFGDSGGTGTPVIVFHAQAEELALERLAEFPGDARTNVAGDAADEDVEHQPTKNPRINVVLTPRIYADVQTLSEARGLSMSSLVEDLIEDALEIQEDMALVALADERKKSLKKSELVSHKKAWT